MKKKYVLEKMTFTAIWLFCSFFQATQAQPDRRVKTTVSTEINKTRPGLSKKNTTVVTGPTEAELDTARVWLIKLGYNLTIDGVRNLKSLTAVGGTVERAQALTTENMKNLRVLTNLESLQLAQFGNDDWVANAAGLTKLKSFIMAPARNLTDRSAEVFGGWTGLKTLMIHGCGITDAGFAKLAGLTQLETLGLQYAKITDASAPIIGSFTNLSYLVISYTNISDAGLPYLYNLKNLKRLDIQSQKITAGAINLLKQQLPNCMIVYP